MQYIYLMCFVLTDRLEWEIMVNFIHSFNRRSNFDPTDEGRPCQAMVGKIRIRVKGERKGFILKISQLLNKEIVWV